jgi:hypothetical protein
LYFLFLEFHFDFLLDDVMLILNIFEKYEFGLYDFFNFPFLLFVFIFDFLDDFLFLKDLLFMLFD